MSRWDAFARSAACVNIALASAAALDYVPMSKWWLHLLLWPSLAFAPIFALAAVIGPKPVNT